jgi:hypothetical protein
LISNEVWVKKFRNDAESKVHYEKAHISWTRG